MMHPAGVPMVHPSPQMYMPAASPEDPLAIFRSLSAPAAGGLMPALPPHAAPAPNPWLISAIPLPSIPIGTDVSSQLSSILGKPPSSMAPPSQ